MSVRLARARLAVRHRVLSGRDDGTALVEFVFLAVVLLVPLVYLVVVLGRLQAGALAVEQASREASRAYVTAPRSDLAGGRALSAAALAYGDQGFPAPREGDVAVTCPGGPCLSPGARVTVRTRLAVALPGVPAFLGRAVPTSVTLVATHTATVDAFGDVRIER